ncbi:MAG: BA14K family protein [Rhizobiaceae bacterium]
MRKLTLSLALAAALAVTPAVTGGDQAQASSKFWGGLAAGIGAALVVGAIVRAGQRHCHAGAYCHAHGYAGPGHYHQAYGAPILYAQPAYAAPPPPPPPVASGYPDVHYQWCSAKYRSYDIASNSFQPFGPNPRRACISPYIR